MVFGLGALILGIALVAIGTRFRKTIPGGILIILGSAITAVGVIFAGMEGLSREA